VQEKLLAQGVACNLVTGQELVQVDGATHISSTVEMADVVIDPGAYVVMSVFCLCVMVRLVHTL